jgi:hypothetical protein
MADFFTDEHLALSVNYRASDYNLFGSDSRWVTINYAQIERKYGHA